MTAVLSVDALDARPAPFGVPDAASDIRLIHEISVALIGEHDSVELYGKIVDAAIRITQSDFGTMQLLRRGDASDLVGELHLLCSRGLPAQAIEFWQRVSPDAHSSCTQALKTGRRAIIPDYEAWDEIAGTEDLLAFRQTGIRSAQTTPLVSRGGRLLGMISTHWRDAHEPSERDLDLLDILARQAADLLDRTLAEEALRERERELATLNLELRHRLKNSLAIVQTLVRQTLKGVDDRLPVDTLLERLIALGAAHDVLFREGWTSATVEQVVRASLSGVAGLERIAFAGPSVMVDGRAAVALSLVLHELATNATKYGALAAQAGLIQLTWSVDAARTHLRLEWNEVGGAPAVQPTKLGFGSRLIDKGLSPGSKVTRSFGPSGFRAEITAPLAELVVDLAEPSDWN